MIRDLVAGNGYETFQTALSGETGFRRSILRVCVAPAVSADGIAPVTRDSPEQPVPSLNVFLVACNSPNVMVYIVHCVI